MTTAFTPFVETRVRMAGRDGDQTVPALVHPAIPHLAITVIEIGLFSVTHVPTGRRLSPMYERMGSAARKLAQWAVLAKVCQVDMACPSAHALKDALCVIDDGPLPFDDAEHATRWAWVCAQARICDDAALGLADEFPAETWSDRPWDRALALLKQHQFILED